MRQLSERKQACQILILYCPVEKLQKSRSIRNDSICIVAWWCWIQRGGLDDREGLRELLDLMGVNKKASFFKYTYFFIHFCEEN